MDERVFHFLLESQALMLELDSLLDKYELRGSALCSVIQGVMIDDPDDENAMKFHSVYNLVAENKEEVEMLADFLQDTWDASDDDDLGSILRNAGISPN